MLLEDLQHIFKPQIDEGVFNLRFMLIENNLQLVHLHPLNDLCSLVSLLDNFQYVESDILTPRFYK